MNYFFRIVFVTIVPTMMMSACATKLENRENLDSGNGITGKSSRGASQRILQLGKPIAEQFRDSDMFYEIKDVFDLQGATVTIPKGCTLLFNGGSIKNGTLVLNECRIVGVGINCNIKQPGNYAYLLSRFLANTDDPNLNYSVVQVLMDSNVPVIIDYPKLKFSHHLSVGSNVAIHSASDQRVVLEFPNSRGFVWDKTVYSQNNYFRGLYVKSKGNGFDFVNSGNVKRPYHVYFSQFSNIKVHSKEGDCFTAGQGNYGASNASCTFDNLFELIEVSAPKGSGFVGLSGNTHHFTKIRCMGCGVSLFYNCSGVFDSCNGTMGVTPTYYTGTRRDKKVAERYSCIFRNCNVEEYKSVLFECKDPLCYMELSFENCSFYITPNQKKIVDYFPFAFSVLLTLSMRNNTFFIYNNGEYDSKHSLMRVFSLSNIVHLDLDKDIQIMDNISKKYKVSKYRHDMK